MPTWGNASPGQRKYFLSPPQQVYCAKMECYIRKNDSMANVTKCIYVKLFYLSCKLLPARKVLQNWNTFARSGVFCFHGNYSQSSEEALTCEI